MINAIATCLAIIAITVVLCQCITHGIDGTIVLSGVAALGGLGGYGVKAVKDLALQWGTRPKRGKDR